MPKDNSSNGSGGLVAMLMSVFTFVGIVFSWIFRTMRRYPITMLIFIPLLIFCALLAFIDWDAVQAALFK